MASLVGRTLAHYRIVETIGSGGMGDVYLADDTKLDRNIALKVLPPELAENEERRGRFEREAKALAALNHPGIVTVYSVEEHGGVHFITMELVKGQKLSELLPLPLEKFFEIATALADAVATAHEHGITHRDLKPDNVMVTDDGDVKVLDFGLAKSRAGFSGDSDPESPTALKTQEGGIVGTVHYMSPEQAEGKTVDHRTDIFSLGIIYYEMLTGKRPFQGDTPAAVLSSILKDEPEAVADAPRELERIFRRCLAKARTGRLQNARDLLHQLEDAREDAHAPSARPLARGASWWRIVAAALILFTAGAVAGIVLRRDDGAARVPRLVHPARVTTAAGLEDYPDWSPDGTAVVYAASIDGDYFSGNWDVWVTQIGSNEPINRTAEHSGVDKAPSWSPDGRQIAFWSDRDGGGYYVMSALGGAPRLVTASSGLEASPPRWSSDGGSLACVVDAPASAPVLEIVELQSRETRQHELPGEDVLRLDLAWSPDGELVAYVDAISTNADATRLVVLRLEDGEHFVVNDVGTRAWSPAWAPDGRTLIFTTGKSGNLDVWQQPLTADGVPAGDPSPLTGGLTVRRLSLSHDGEKIAYSRGRLVGNLWRVPIFEDRPARWSDAEQLTFDEAEIEGIDISPDGRFALFDSDREGKADLWTLELNSSTMVQVTTDSADDFGGTWSPDGDAIAFYSLRSGNRDIFVHRLSGGPVEQLTDGPEEDVYPSWSPNGDSLVYSALHGDFSELRWMRADGSSHRSLLPDRRYVLYPNWSHHGRGVVFSDWTGAHSVWHKPSLDAEPIRLTDKSAHYATWSRDGTEVLFITTEDHGGNIWSHSLLDASERLMTSFEGRLGQFGWGALATDGDYLYFVWQENLGDIWTMDVVY